MVCSLLGSIFRIQLVATTSMFLSELSHRTIRGVWKALLPDLYETICVHAVLRTVRTYIMLLTDLKESYEAYPTTTIPAPRTQPSTQQPFDHDPLHSTTKLHNRAMFDHVLAIADEEKEGRVVLVPHPRKRSLSIGGLPHQVVHTVHHLMYLLVNLINTPINTILSTKRIYTTYSYLHIHQRRKHTHRSYFFF